MLNVIKNILIKNIIIYIILTLLLITQNSYAYELINNTKIEYNIAKKLLLKKKYKKSKFFFYRIIYLNKPFNKYGKKSRLYLIIMMLQKKHKRKAHSKLKTFYNAYRTKQFFNYVSYLSARTVYDDKKYKRFIKWPIKHYKRAQKNIKKTFKALKKIRFKTHKNTKLLLTKRRFNNIIKKHKLYVKKYFLIKHLHTIVIKESIHIDRKKNKYFYQKIFMLIKSYNELFYNNIAKKLLAYSKYKTH